MRNLGRDDDRKTVDEASLCDELNTVLAGRQGGTLEISISSGPMRSAIPQLDDVRGKRMQTAVALRVEHLGEQRRPDRRLAVVQEQRNKRA